MDLAYVVKLNKENNVVKYPEVSQYLFDRTIDVKGMKSKNSKKTVSAFIFMITKRPDTTKFVTKGEQNWLESFETFAELKEYKLILQAMRLRLHLLNVQHDSWKMYSTATLNTLDPNTFADSHNSEFPKKNVR